MKGALIVDWDNLRTSLKRLGYSSSPQLVAEALRSKATEFAVAENSKLDHIEVYASPAGFGSPTLQEIWLHIGYNLHPTPPDPETSRQEIYGEVLSLLYSQNFDFFIIATGDYDYTPLMKKLETSGARCHIWLADATKSRAGRSSSIRIPVLLQLPLSVDSRVDAGEITAFEGVVKVIESEIIRRTQRQLEEEARKYSTNATVNKVFDTLTERIQTSDFAPDVIIAWTDYTKHRIGSEAVANELHSRLMCPTERVGIREEGERREIQFIPDLSHNHRALIVDDATFSGKTLNLLETILKAKYPTIEFRTAVLSAQVPVTLPVNYYGDMHSTDDLLFPWGWARRINKFYDLLRQIGIQDKVWVSRELTNAILTSTIVKDQLCTVQVLSCIPDLSVEETFTLISAKHQTDELLYVVSGEVEVQIEESKGVFRKEEFLFIPRIVPYHLVLRSDSILLRFALESLQRKE
jgi:hypoxanthine phosphoribosyltransferase